MNRILEVCLVAVTLATSITPSAAAKPVTVPQNSSFAGAAQAPQKGVSVQMPVTSNAAPMPDADSKDARIVAVTESGSVYLGIDPVPLVALADKIKSSLSNSTQKLYVKADARTPYANVVKVLEALRIGGLESPILLTDQPESSQPGARVSPKGLEVMLTPPSGSQPTVVQVNSGQQTPLLRIDNRQIPWANLQNMLTQLFQNRSEKMVLLKADGQLPFADVVHVIDTCHSAGAKVVLAAPQL